MMLEGRELSNNIPYLTFFMETTKLEGFSPFNFFLEPVPSHLKNHGFEGLPLAASKLYIQLNSYIHVTFELYD